MIKKISVASKPRPEMPLVAMRGLVLFPGNVAQFDVGRKCSIEAVEWAAKNDSPIFLVSQKDTALETPEKGDLLEYGVVAEIRQVFRISDDFVKVLVACKHRARLRKFNSDNSFYSCTVTRAPYIHISEEDSELADATVRSIRKQLEIYAGFYPKLSPDIMVKAFGLLSREDLTGFLAYNLSLEYEDKQELLICSDSLARLQLLLTVLTRENNLLGLEHEIEEKVKEEIDRNQRDYFLREQMQIIQDELGNSADDTLEEADEYEKKIKELHLETDSEEKLLKETDRLRRMQGNNQEATVIRSYLDYCLDLPWNDESKDNFDLNSARKKLDSDHFGLNKIKERIIELLAVRSATEKMNGQILCFVGPPGVGKTSIAKSIAECMGRKYVRISLGGVKDESEIRGHRRTYLGSMPGRIVTALISAKTKNPLILLDEIDKLGNDYKGDPASALLEALDPEQNFAFNDHFIDIPFDLSRVLFITTANDAGAIPAPLYDRMEIIELSSYTRTDKFQIAKRHLLPREMDRHALNKAMFAVSDKALYRVIDEYTSEAGVRELERVIAKLCRKALTEIKSKKTECVKIEAADIEEYLGVPLIKAPTYSRKNQVGVCNGLAWTAVGGAILPIEVVVNKGTGKLELTGSLGDVMKESAKLALTNAVKLSARYGYASDFAQKCDIHIHAPEGAVKKDGPSAGVTLTAALVSALSGYEARANVAMTGEITLTGEVIPIGGLREKLIAADKAGIKTVIIPAENECDLSECDQRVLKRLNVVTAKRVIDVLERVLIVPKGVKPLIIEPKPETAVTKIIKS